jgi:hypothetical protein
MAIIFVREHGAILGTVFPNRDGSATAYSIHPAPSGGTWTFRAPNVGAGEVWVRAIHQSWALATAPVSMGEPV